MFTYHVFIVTGMILLTDKKIIIVNGRIISDNQLKRKWSCLNVTYYDDIHWEGLSLTTEC
jgi:hypothetical protein